MFGAITGEFDTVADMEERVVHIGERKVTDLRFPDAKDANEEAALKTAIKRISKVAGKGTLHKNTASRKISRLQRKVNAAKS